MHDGFYLSNPGFPREQIIAELHIGHCRVVRGMTECLDY